MRARCWVHLQVVQHARRRQLVFEGGHRSVLKSRSGQDPTTGQRRRKASRHLGALAWYGPIACRRLSVHAQMMATVPPMQNPTAPILRASTSGRSPNCLSAYHPTATARMDIQSPDQSRCGRSPKCRATIESVALGLRQSTASALSPVKIGLISEVAHSIMPTPRSEAAADYEGHAQGSRLLAPAGCVRAARARAADQAMSIGVAVGGEQVSAHVTVGLRPRGIITVRQMPGHRLQTASRIDLLPRMNDSAAALERRPPESTHSNPLGRFSLGRLPSALLRSGICTPPRGSTRPRQLRASQGGLRLDIDGCSGHVP